MPSGHEVGTLSRADHIKQWRQAAVIAGWIGVEQAKENFFSDARTIADNWTVRSIRRIP
jgi:hypothetical protein